VALTGRGSLLRLSLWAAILIAIMSLHIGIDIGGTFTDFVLFDTESQSLQFFKVPSTRPADIGVLKGLEKLSSELGADLNKISRIVHGSTVATNALIEKKWAKTALITTQGFRDVLEIGRQQRDSLYDFNVDRAEPIVPRERRYEVSERVDAMGNVLTPLDESAVSALIPKLKGCEAVAISFLFSYLNPEHEERVKLILERELDVPIMCSSSVLPEYREYERTSTTVVNAALRPIVGAYIENLAAEISDRGIDGSFEIMQSNGGLVDAAIAKDHSESLLFSGPAGGVAASTFLGELSNQPNLIAFDMGGTSCDVSLIANGRALQRVESKLAGYQIRVPMVDIHSVGAGGGSIAWIDSGGALRVGPQSAGSVPGPASYGTGEEPTVTDAQLVLGRFDPKNTLGSRTLDPSRAANAIKQIAEPLGMSLEEAAIGILEIADAHMERAIRVISVERGHDPRDYALLAFGGGGPLHGCSVAERLGISTVIVPSTAGVLSALGMLMANVKRDRVQSVLKLSSEISERELEALYSAMADQIFEELNISDSSAMRLMREIEFRYRGQAYEIPISVERELRLSQLEAQFHETHQKLFGYSLTDHPTEIVSLRVEGIVHADSIELPRVAECSERLEPKTREIYLSPNQPSTANIYDRSTLRLNDTIAGPAVIEGSDSTILVPNDWKLRIDQYGTAILERDD